MIDAGIVNWQDCSSRITFAVACPDARTARPEAYESLIGRTFGAEVSLTGLSFDVAKKLASEDVSERLRDLFVHRGVPEHIRSANGSEFTVKCVREWLARIGMKTLFIARGRSGRAGAWRDFSSCSGAGIPAFSSVICRVR